MGTSVYRGKGEIIILKGSKLKKKYRKLYEMQRKHILVTAVVQI